MRNMLNNISSWCDNLVRVITREFRSIFTDSGVMLILFGAIFIYSTLYSLAYRNEVVREVPIAVIDLNQTTTSRSFVQALGASPSVDIAYEPTNIEAAKQLFYQRKVYGVIVIPVDFEKKIAQGVQSKFAIYADASYFLMYKSLFTATSNVMAVTNYKIEVNNFMKSGMSEVDAQILAEPVELGTVKLFNRNEGYGIFVMPAIMLLIIQQALLIGIGIIGGTFNERKMYSLYRNKQGVWYSPFTVVMGKLLCYLAVMSVLMIIVFGVYYKFWGYPSRASIFDVMFYVIPYIISVSAMSVALSTMFAKRENAILMLVIWSIPFLLLCAISFPVEGMPSWLYHLGLIIPCSSAVMGFLRLEVMGATLNDVNFQYNVMWLLSAIYTVLAVLMMRWRLKKSKKDFELN